MPHDPTRPSEREGPGCEGMGQRGPNAEAGGAGNHNEKAPPPDTAEDDEPIGYRRPPKQHRFPPGKSGNPKGRTRGAKGMRTILRKEFNERVRITENGKTRKISKMELLVKRLAEKGAKGDSKSIIKLIDLGMMVFGMEDEISEAPSLTRDEQAIIDQAVKRRRALAGQGQRRRAARSKPKAKRSNEANKGDDQ